MQHYAHNGMISLFMPAIITNANVKDGQQSSEHAATECWQQATFTAVLVPKLV